MVFTAASETRPSVCTVLEMACRRVCAVSWRSLSRAGWLAFMALAKAEIWLMVPVEVRRLKLAACWPSRRIGLGKSRSWRTRLIASDSLSYTTSSASVLSDSTRQLFLLNAQSAAMAVMVCDLPVPGGPSTTTIRPCGSRTASRILRCSSFNGMGESNTMRSTSGSASQADSTRSPIGSGLRISTPSTMPWNRSTSFDPPLRAWSMISSKSFSSASSARSNAARCRAGDSATVAVDASLADEDSETSPPRSTALATCRNSDAATSNRLCAGSRYWMRSWIGDTHSRAMPTASSCSTKSIARRLANRRLLRVRV
ncbi:hypothetical protein D3C72_1364960 [compost metagenome]